MFAKKYQTDYFLHSLYQFNIISHYTKCKHICYIKKKQTLNTAYSLMKYDKLNKYKNSTQSSLFQNIF
jgi:hypothetical protein